MATAVGKLPKFMERSLIDILSAIDNWYQWEYVGDVVRAPGGPATGGGGHTL